MLNTTELEAKFGAVKEHGQELASKFKAFVLELDSVVPNGVSKTKLVNALQEASNWGHNALAEAEQAARNLAHQRAKSGEKPPTTEPQTAPPAVIPTQGVTPVDAPPAS